MKYEREYAWEAICEEAIQRFEKQYQNPDNPAYEFFLLCHEHYKGFFLLCRNGLYGSAQALLRPMVEASLRGWWLSNHASDKEIKKFVKRGKLPRMSKLRELLINDSATREQFLPRDFQRVLNGFSHGYAKQPISVQQSEETTYGIRSTAASVSYFAMLLLAARIGRGDVVELLEETYSNLMAHYTDSESDAE